MNSCAGAMGAGRLLRRVKAVRLALVLVVGLIFAVVWSEDAHAVSNTDTFRFSSDLCIKERSMTYVWSQDGRLYGQSVTRPFSGDCSTPLSLRAEHLWGEVWVQKWSNYGYWYTCSYTGWYNASRTSRHVVWTDLGPRYYRECYEGYYRTLARGWVLQNGTWKNTPWVLSGYGYFY
jgi:hypothetical protein